MTDIKLPPLPEWMSNYTIPADGFGCDKDVMLVDRMHDYARAAVLADREARQQDARDGRYMSGVADLPEATCERCGLRVISSCCPDNPAECPVPDAYEHRRAQRGKEPT